MREGRAQCPAFLFLFYAHWRLDIADQEMKHCVISKAAIFPLHK